MTTARQQTQEADSVPANDSPNSDPTAKSATTAPPQNPKSKKKQAKKKPRDIHNPAPLLDVSSRRRTEAASSTSEQAKREAVPLTTKAAALKKASARYTASVSRVSDAAAAAAPFMAAIGASLVPLAAVLRVVTGGRPVLNDLGTNLAPKRAERILNRLPSGLGVPSILVAGVRAALKAGEPALTELAAARQAKRNASAAYKAAAADLEAQCGLVWTTLTRHRIVQRVGKTAG